jgi:predicted nucleic acid-binding protein
MSVFVDASAFYALINKNDILHLKAREISEGLSEKGEILITSNYTLAEAFTVIRSRMGYDTAEKFINEIKKNPLQIIWIDEAMHIMGMEIFLEKREPMDLSFFDCVDCALMKVLNIERAFSFDRHFKALGIEVIEN